MKKKEPTLMEQYKEGLIRSMAMELDEMHTAADDSAKAAAALRWHRLQEDYNRIVELENEDKKSKRELTGNIVAPAITTIGGLAATGIWIAFEKSEVVTGASGKEILRSVVSTIFKKK